VNQTELFNQTLLKIGSEKVLSSDQDSEERVLCSIFYADARDEVLIEYPWSCALRRSSLALVEKSLGLELPYRYALPTDPYCIRPVTLLDPETGKDLSTETWQKEGHSIWTRLNPCAVRYVARLDVSELDPHVAEVLVYKLAAKVAYRIVQDLSVENQMVALYAARLREAKTLEGTLGSMRYQRPALWTEV